MNCKEYKDFTQNWLNHGELPHRIISSLEDHILGCSKCRGESESIIKMIKAFEASQAKLTLPKDIGETDLKSSIMAKINDQKIQQYRSKNEIFRRLTAVAAALLILFGVVFAISKLNTPGISGEVIVQFTLYAPEATTVSLVGDFTNWKPLELNLDQQGHWFKSIRLKPKQSYLYNFLINGQTWIPDPQADMNIEDGFGGKNSVINL